MASAQTYTQEQLDIALLKNSQEGILREMSHIREELRSQGHWNIGLILGIYALIGGSAIAKLFGVL